MQVINQVKLNINHNFDDLVVKVSKLLHLKKKDIDLKRFKILRKSIDARDKMNIQFVYNIAIDYDEKEEFKPIIIQNTINNIRPIVVGFGPAGIFASYIFALNGLRPIIIERGKSIDERLKDVQNFIDNMILNENSNICFGEGGAGAFSDGKLNTNNKDKTGVYKYVLETFVKYGASDSILYENLPHIGTDKLIDVIGNIRREILSKGGEIRYNTKFTYDEYKNYAQNGTPIILAIGNSSRDTFRDLIKNGFDLKPKAFAIGYRVAHKQSLINSIQYGDAAVKFYQNEDISRNVLPPATYKLVYDVGNGHSVYSFCMCPGGYIINSSNFNGYLSINGMSYNDRAGKYANSAIVETIKPSDLGAFISALDIIDFQERIEKMAFDIEKGYIPYNKINILENDDRQYNGDINKTNYETELMNIFKGQAKYSEKLKQIYDSLDLDFNINNDIREALMYFNKIMPGFYSDNPLIAGVETRTSSPVALDRDEQCMCNIKNFYPCGEGLGHGGGILSCAADGINVALKVIKSKKNV